MNDTSKRPISGGHRRDHKHRMYLNIGDRLLADLRAIAERDETSVAEVARRLLREAAIRELTR